ncbi:MAG TPA: hypothetical protein VFU47_03240 [Armatimonadota bacterium]|nr:hypothetical protein [Armatimonadota bacterium]
MALLRPGHFVLVERAVFPEVTGWDPSGAGRDQPAERPWSREEWQREWAGAALAVR